MTRGLNRNHNPMLKEVFKGAANAAAVKPGPLPDYYEASVARGVHDELAKVTLARRIAAAGSCCESQIEPCVTTPGDRRRA